MHSSLRGDTIDDVKRIVVVQGTDTTDADSGRTRGSTVSRDVHARDTSLHRLDGVVLVLLGKLANTDNRDGTRQVSLTLGGITRYDHLVQCQGIVLHGDFHAISSRQLLGLKADVREGQCLTSSHLQLEVTVEIGNSSV